MTGITKIGCWGLAALFALAPGTASSRESEETWSPQLFLGGRVGTERSIAEGEWMQPLLWGSGWLLSSDLRWRSDSESTHEGNLGLLYRRRMDDDRWVLGAYGFADRLLSENDHHFHQLTLGAEMLRERFELRVNAYLPERREEIATGTAAQVVVNGNTIAVDNGSFVLERALRGMDVEAGYRLPFSGPMGTEDVWLYGGFFHFGATGYDEVTGPRVRAEWSLDLASLPLSGERAGELVLGGEWQTDAARGSQGFGSLEFRIPLGAAARVSAESVSWVRKRMQRRVRRDVDVVTGTAASGAPRALENGVNPDTGTDYSGIYFAEAGASGAGTLEDPTGLDNAIALAGSDGLVVALGDAGRIDTRGVSLRSGAGLIGGGASIPVTSASGAMASYTAPGMRPTLFGTNRNRAVLTLANGANDISVGGLDLDGGRWGIRGIRNTNVRVWDVNVRGSRTEGIRLDRGSGYSFTDVNLDGTGVRGYWLRNVAGPVDIQGGSVRNLTGNSRALQLTNTSGAVNVDGLDVDSVRHGMQIHGRRSFDVTLANSTFSNVGRYAVLANVTNSAGGSFRVNDNQLASARGVYLRSRRGAPVSFEVTGNTISTTRNANMPIFLEARDGGDVTATVLNNSLTSSGANSFYARSLGATSRLCLSLDGNTASDRYNLQVRGPLHLDGFTGSTMGEAETYVKSRNAGTALVRRGVPQGSCP